MCGKIVAKSLQEDFFGAYGLSKHLPVFLLGTENVVGGWMAILVVVCGKTCGKMCGKMCGKI